MSGRLAWRDDWERRLTVVAFFTCLTLFLFHFFLVWHYAVDVPFWDEWSMFGPAQLPAGFSLRSISTQHLEHRFATTKLLIWLLYSWNGWDVALHQRFNFLLFGVLLVLIGGFVKRTMPATPLWVILSFLLFALSPINWMNHFMAYQTSTHLYVLLVLSAAWLVFEPPATKTRLLLGGIVCMLLTFTSAAGAAATLIVGSVFIARELGPLARQSAAGRAMRLAAVVLPIALAIGLWLDGYQHEAGSPALTLPTSWGYWTHFLAVVALGFGDEGFPITGGIWIAAVLVPLVAALREPDDSAASRSWAPFAAALALLAGVAAISLGRASFGVAQARSSRYAEYLLPLLPLTGAAWYRSLNGRRNAQLAAVALLWVTCSLTFLDDWRAFRFYAYEGARRRAGLECAERYYYEASNGVCPTIFPDDFPGGLAPFLDSAKRLNASFYRKMVARQASIE
jgi:hypothetical protein